MNNNITKIGIPAYVSSWTDEYFHKSAFDVPIKYPNQNIVKFLSQFKKSMKIKLYRGINEFNEENALITSWTYDREIAKRYIESGGKVIEKNFSSERILLDTTTLTNEQKNFLGYSYELDDKEVLILSQ